MSTASASGLDTSRRAHGPQDPGRVLPRARGGRGLRQGHRDGDDDGRRDPARPVHARGRGGPGHGAGAAAERAGGVGRRLRTPFSAQAVGGTEPPGQKNRPGLLPLPAAGPGRPARDRAARDARRHRHRLAEPAAGEPALAAGDQGTDRPVGVHRGQGPGARARLLEHLHLQRGRGHQGVHEDVAGRRGRRPRRVLSPLHARDGAVVDGHDRGGQLDRVRRRLRARHGVRLPHRGGVGHVRPAGGQPRDHPRASAAPSGCRGWWASRRRSR